MIKILKYSDTSADEILSRDERITDVRDAVKTIIDDVRRRGDAAVIEYATRFDGIDPDSFKLEMSIDERKAAVVECERMYPELSGVLGRAAANIAAFHEAQLRTGFRMENADGSVCGQRILPLERAGIYVPGGTAAYPSTVLMTAIPALKAGCREIIIVTPPDPNGDINPVIASAADAAEKACDAFGRISIFRTGGAQAVAALAYGTESVPKADKIVGPGNAYVAEAKRQVFGLVSIDMIAGPSEILIISDEKTDPAYVAADMLAQAEHDKMASAVLVTDSDKLAGAVQNEIEKQLTGLKREEIARASIENNGKIIVADSIDEAVDIANEIAPEHLELCLDDAADRLAEIRNAGSVFLGRSCPEAVGDYYAGPNHTLPTGGTARFCSPLSVDDFIKKMQFIYYPEEALFGASDDIASLAGAEGLTAHANSVLIRTGRKS